MLDNITHVLRKQLYLVEKNLEKNLPICVYLEKVSMHTSLYYCKFRMINSFANQNVNRLFALPYEVLYYDELWLYDAFISAVTFFSPPHFCLFHSGLTRYINVRSNFTDFSDK